MRCGGSTEHLSAPAHTHAASANPYDPKHFFRGTLNCPPPCDQHLLNHAGQPSENGGPGCELPSDSPQDQSGEDSDTCDINEDYDGLSIPDTAQYGGTEGRAGVTGSSLEVDDDNDGQAIAALMNQCA